VPQDHSGATFCRRLDKADGVLDFSAPASVLAARVNGLHPWPSVTLDVTGVAVKLGQADAVEGTAGSAPGTVTGPTPTACWWPPAPGPFA
jgi:methionyl-tRNA formyltransferase